MDGFYDRFSRMAERFGERTAVEMQRRDGLEIWTYGRLRDRTEELAGLLSSRGIQPGDRCALLAENDAQWCAAYLGMLHLGAVPVPLDTTYTAPQIARLITDCGAKLIVASPRFREAATDGGNRASCPFFPLEQCQSDDDRLDLPAAATVELEDTAAILYTSGTTSDPKGVVLTHGNLLGEIDATVNVVSLNKDDAVLGVLPLFHVLAQLANLLLPLSVGARVVFLDTLSSGELLRALKEREISAFCCVPQFFYLVHERLLEQVSRASWLRRKVFWQLLRTAGFLRERLGINLGPTLFARVHQALGPRMRLLVTGGSRFDPNIGRDLYRLGFNILQAYGLTESSGAATVLRPGDRHVGSVGQALPGVELKIIRGETTEAGERATTENDQIGEIAIRGPIISPGYFRREDANAVTFRSGWLHTGDLGYIDAAGRLYVTGRAKDVIVLSSGKNIYPEEIEAHYAQSPYVKELCVMGRTVPGAPAAERLHAVVVPDFDVLREEKIFNAREMLRWEIETFSTQLPGHKRILSYDLATDDLPRTTTRKLKRFEIERQFASAQEKGPTVSADRERSEPAGDTSWAADPRTSRTLEALRSLTRLPETVSRESNLELDVGLDSIGRVELLAALEARLGVSLADEVTHSIHTIGDLVDAVRDADVAPGGLGDSDSDPWSSLLDVSEDDPAVAPLLVKRPLLAAALFVASRFLFVMAWLLLGLRVSGREHLPKEGPFLISPNHQSYLDAFLLVSTLPYRVFRNAFYVGASEYFSTRFLGWIARMIHVVPVDPDTNLVHAMRAGFHGLRGGKILILFPEGERSIDATVKTFKKGAAILSLKAGAPIVPVALDGMHEIWPRAGRPRLGRLLSLRARTRIRFGPPLEPATGQYRPEEAYASATQRLRSSVEELLSSLRGRDPRLAE